MMTVPSECGRIWWTAKQKRLRNEKLGKRTTERGLRNQGAKGLCKIEMRVQEIQSPKFEKKSESPELRVVFLNQRETPVMPQTEQQ
jgi:hypothetical protein